MKKARKSSEEEKAVQKKKKQKERGSGHGQSPAFGTHVPKLGHYAVERSAKHSDDSEACRWAYQVRENGEGAMAINGARKRCGEPKLQPMPDDVHACPRTLSDPARGLAAGRSTRTQAEEVVEGMEVSSAWLPKLKIRVWKGVLLRQAGAKPSLSKAAGFNEQGN